MTLMDVAFCLLFIFNLAPLFLLVRFWRCVPYKRLRYFLLLAWTFILLGLFWLGVSVWQSAAGQEHPLSPFFGGCDLFVGALARVFCLRRQSFFYWAFRQDPTHCGCCGYDLTGNVSGVCPECGWHLPPPTGFRGEWD